MCALVSSFDSGRCFEAPTAELLGVAERPARLPLTSSVVAASVCRVLKLRFTLKDRFFCSSFRPFAFSTKLSISCNFEAALEFAPPAPEPISIGDLAGCGMTWWRYF